jgi:hypothetical protein
MTRRPRRVSTRRSRRTKVAIRGVFCGEERVRRCRDDPGGRGLCAGGDRVASVFSGGGTPADRDLDHEQGRDGGAEGPGDNPVSTRVQPEAA